MITIHTSGWRMTSFILTNVHAFSRDQSITKRPDFLPLINQPKKNTCNSRDSLVRHVALFNTAYNLFRIMPLEMTVVVHIVFMDRAEYSPEFHDVSFASFLDMPFLTIAN